MVLVRLLGPVEVIDDSGAVRPIDSALRRTLLALLAIHAGEVLTFDWLLEHAWAAEPPESGLRALRFHISRLRKELGESDVIETRPNGYRLVISADNVDALAIEANARAAKLEPDRNKAADMYSEVLAVWRGEPFVDAAPCADLDDEAGRLVELRLSITEDYFQARLDAGAGRELVADLWRATTQTPLREALWSMLITAQYRAGLQADALRSYEQMRATLAESLGLDPSIELQELQRRVLQHDPSLVHDLDLESAKPSARHNLPTPATSLIDSGDRLGFVTNLLRSHRLVTLTGTGGVGKTRLAIELGWASLDLFESGIWLVELAPVTHTDAVMNAVASTLSIRQQQGLGVVESLIDWFHGRDLLLIIDNCEHVLDSVKQMLVAVLARCPTVTVLATSREPFGLLGERVHSVDVLNPEYDGFALFLDRAVAADSSFVLGETERGAVAEICRRLDGLPLAIELAAARVRSLAPVDLLARLEDRFRLLRGASRSGLDRHDTLWTTVQWSYQLLADQERVIFDRLSVFAGGFDLRAAEVVCTAGTIDESDVVDLLRNLVDKSMVLAERNADGTRYQLLETLRQFGEERLGSEGEAGEVRDRHTDHYLDVAEGARTLFRSARQVTGALIFGREWDNLRRAHQWAVMTGNLPMAERLITLSFQYAASLQRLEHGDWVDQTIALGTVELQPSPDTFARAAYWAYGAENIARADDLLIRGLDVAVSTDDPDAVMIWAMAGPDEHPSVPDPFRRLEIAASNVDLDQEWWVLDQLADLAKPSGSEAQVLYLARLVETAERVRAPSLIVAAALQNGHRSISQQPPDFAAALDLYTRALDTARQCGDRTNEGDCLRAIAMATVGLHPDRALEACREALVQLHEIRYWYRIWNVFASIGLSLASVGRAEDASLTVGYLEAHHQPFGIEHNLGYRARTLEIVGSDPRVKEWKTRGAAMDRYQIVDYALAALQ
jgi:predicted ATPase/DNA-binding SARP family transcriptional activator